MSDSVSAPPTEQELYEAWKNEVPYRAWPPAWDAICGNPFDICVCGKERQEHGHGYSRGVNNNFERSQWLPGVRGFELAPPAGEDWII